MGRRRSVWKEEEEDRREWKKINVRGIVIQTFILDQKNGWDTIAIMSNKFPVSCKNKNINKNKTSRQIYKRKVQTLSGASFESTICSKLKIHIPSYIVQAAFNKK